MRKAEPPSSFGARLLAVGARAACIFLGGTLTAHWLAANSTLATADGSGLPSYVDWLVDAASPRRPVAEALGNTLLLGAAAILIGAVLGALIGLLFRLPRLRPASGPVAGAILAVAVPGIALFPVVFPIVDAGLVPAGPVPIGESLEDGARFLGLWGAVVGLSVVPVAMVSIQSGPLRSPEELGVARAPMAARPEPWRRWRFGIPTTTFVLALAAAEISSGHRGLFRLFVEASSRADLLLALDVVVVVVAAGVVLTVAVDSLGLGIGPPEREPVVLPIRTSRSIGPLVVALAATAAVALVGVGLESPAPADPSRVVVGPTFGGPWLGTDALGRSSLSMTLAAIGPALLAGVLPALAALALGWPLAWLRHTAGGAVRRALAGAVDLVWWPAPLMVPLALLFFDLPERPELHLGVIGFVALTLTPLASRLLGRGVLGAGGDRLVRGVAAFLFCGALAVSIHLLYGYMGFAVDTTRPDLGALIAENQPRYGRSAWPLVVPALAAVWLPALLYWLSSALVVPDSTRARIVDASGAVVAPSVDQDDIALSSGPAPSAARGPDVGDLRIGATDSTTEPDGSVPAPVDASADPFRAPLPFAAPAEPEPAVPDDGPPMSDRPVEVDARTGPALRGGSAGQPEAAADDAGAGRPATDRPGPDLEDSDLGDPDRGDTARDGPAQDDDDLGDTEGPDEAVVDAMKTIELRPSTLRRAGITLPTGGNRRPPSLAMSKPTLATRAPAPLSDDTANDDDGPLDDDRPDR